MPELPEVETVRRTLAPAVGARIEAVWDSGKPLHMQRRPPRAKLRALVGATIVAIRRHGKYLLVDTDRPQSLLVHLGMTGRFCIVDAATPRANHTHLVLGLDARELRFVDARRFGQLDVVERARERLHPALAVLGPDALVDGVDATALVTLAKRRKTTLKAFVLDQSVLAGVGNIYASEALWRAKLRPTKRSNKLTVAAAALLAAAIRETLENALENGGTTLSDFVAADGVAGENADYLWVYARAGQPCLECKTLIKRAVHQGRATYYCPTCQTP
ncbi:MAG: bifunctional DNA-formamidopyrimidine glycosylase/DNA-(apurinic or apyrimidinic site) lyase [Deltaproteobacteria bacterium]|nr:bifunctional DNA-formamidopyrimidine glycosylase/DNA-(apurinic or apyrimidinic site) lyase [Deltaproteobacteria bacterium]MDQ3295033.1 bifunctional DNA-formamidopyrimidine glycosylase/DNA-(apurinic or apyrimidinic site) lyase [Myxococcota bacterium]